MENFNIKEELKKLPDKPGVYLMHKSGGEIIYVGKAKNLKNRVRQYFNESYKKSNKISQMVSNIDYFEYIVVDNELESLILEANLIKEYRPRYNTLLKDDKNYPYIKVTINEDYPRVFFVHRKSKDAAKYFGPYKSGTHAKIVLDFIKSAYQLRTCRMPINSDTNKNSSKKYKECLYYHLNMCLGPCIDKSVKNKYDENVKEVIDFLSGKHEKALEKLTKKMNEASEKEDFEKAIEYRDKINSIYEISEKQKIEQAKNDDKDIIGMYRANDLALVQIFEVRDGNIIDRNINFLNIDEKDTDEEIYESFIKQYYNQIYFMPSEIWISKELEDKKLLEEWLSKNADRKIKIVTPKIGQNDKLVKLANMNAKIQWDIRANSHVKEKNDIDIALSDLCKITGQDVVNRLESYDISNTAGSINVASMVVFEGYNFKRNDYRKFRIKSVSGPDDYASMTEVIERRIKHYIDDDMKFGAMPNIFLIDGGLGQVGVVKQVLDKYAIDIPVIGMVKDDNHKTRALVYDEYEIDLKNFKELFKLITKIQDETHRFAIEYHKSLRSKAQVSSILDDIKGIGEKRKLALIRHFKDIDSIKNAKIEEISKVQGFDKKSAEAVFKFFNEEQ